MGTGPPIPSDCTLPESVGEWQLDRDAPKNGHVWYGPNRECSVGVYGFCGDIVGKVHDERVGGFDRSERLFEITPKTTEEYYNPGSVTVETPAVVRGIERVGQWMAENPNGWKHPAVEPAVFEAPPGFELEGYWLENREHIVCYRQTSFTSDSRVNAHAADFEWSLDTCEYLYVEVWRGSGNATVSLAPYMRAHDEKKLEVIEPPAECGVARAVETVHEWVTKQRAQSVTATV